MAKTALKRLLYTPGEPAGIGPDILLALPARHLPVEWVTVADIDLIKARCRQLGLSRQIVSVDPTTPPQAHTPGQIRVWHVPLRTQAQAGVLHTANAAYVLETLRTAVDLCLSGDAHALVTGPVHKGIINSAGYPFSGHTEYLAERTGAPCPVMMLLNKRLKVALVTTHVPLSQVTQLIQPERLRTVLSVLRTDLIQKFRIPDPHIFVTGLNPHAGEGGHLGLEEQTVIEPVLNECRALGWRLTGPLPADTAFQGLYLEEADAFLTMYHDQGLPVLKSMSFGEAVNITLGLPLIRTSVDHGTALDLAGSGRAQTGSLAAALELAVQLATGEHP